jgi:hypothetical protein
LSHQAYPAFSLDCVKDVIRIVRGGTITAELPLFAKCVYTLVGAGLGAAIGEPPDVAPALAAADSDAELRECCAALESVAGVQMAAAEGEQAIDPATIALLVQLAVQLIQAFLNRKK